MVSAELRPKSRPKIDYLTGNPKTSFGVTVIMAMRSRPPGPFSQRICARNNLKAMVESNGGRNEPASLPGRAFGVAGANTGGEWQKKKARTEPRPPGSLPMRLCARFFVWESDR